MSHKSPDNEPAGNTGRGRPATEPADSACGRARLPSNEAYQTLFGAIEQGFCIMEVLFDADDQAFDWRFIDVNPAFEKQGGPPDAVGRTIRDLLPAIEPEWIENCGRVARTGKPRWFDEYSSAFNRWFDVYVFRVGAPDANQVAALFRDITEDKRADVDCAQLAAIVDSCEDGIISKDLNGTMQTWNGAAQRLFGYTAEEAIGQPVTLLIPAERMAEEDDILRRIGQGQSIDTFETVRRRKDGSLVDVSLTISPIADKTGRIIGASKIVRDITERRRAALLQDHQTQLLELIAAGASLDECLNALCLAVPQIVPGVRASVLLADAARAAFEQAIAPELAPSWEEGLADAPINDLMIGTCGEAVFRGQPVTCEDVTTDDRWSPQWRELCEANGVLAGHSVPVWSENHEPVACFMLCFDRARGPSAWERELAAFGSRVVSIALARNRTHNALRAADRRKNEFLATLAHELRNPLAPLRNGLAVMGRNNPETTARARALMERQMTQLKHLVDDLMDLSRITSGRITLQSAPTDFTAVVRDAVETTRPVVDAAGHTLDVTLPAESVCLPADADRVTQLLVNLIINAAKYTPANGHIEVGLEQNDDTAVFWVRDNGVGISADKLPHIFDMFEQADPPEGRAKDGLGIGLTLARQVVELHGGTIDATSAGRDHGAEFVVRLPLAADAPAATTRQEPNSAAPAAPAAPVGLRVMVVDDNHDVADGMQLLLDSLGHDVLIAYDGLQALDAVAAFRPDAIFLDIGLPGIDGYETARRLRATPEGRDVLLVALTGWGQEEHRKGTAEAGFDQHLIKPVDPDVLEGLLVELGTTNAAAD